MEILNIISIIIGSPLFGILLDISYAHLKNKTPFIKRINAWITNKKYSEGLQSIFNNAAKF